MDNQHKLLYLRGVANEYQAYSGEIISIPLEDRLGILRAMGVDVDDQDAIAEQIFELDAKKWTTWLPPYSICSKGGTDPLHIYLHPNDLYKVFDWKIITECQQQFTGQFESDDLTCCGDYVIDGVKYLAFEFDIESLPLGFHTLSLTADHQTLSSNLIVCPPTCFEPLWSQNHDKLWGFTIQLYSLRTERNWGIGDFTDLATLIKRAAAAGADAICLNPLHALDLSHPKCASPYSPDDRRFINPLYIDVQQEPDCTANSTLQKMLRGKSWRNKIERLRVVKNIDYKAVFELKFDVFTQMYQYFVQQELHSHSDRARDFEQFVKQGGDPLQIYCQFQAERLQNSAVVKCVEPQFFAYLQWIAECQFAHCQNVAREVGMRTGIIRDLAVGAIADGNEVLSNISTFCTQASIGAPPDPLAPQGQNWGLTPMEPLALRQSQYQHFLNLLRANMRHAGALRIDHVIGLMRVWWWQRDHDHSSGAYAYHHVEDMLALLRLESQRNQCMVIGEDLGIVPGEFRKMLSDSKIYTNVLMYFEKYPDNHFKLPHDYPTKALAMLANHDVPTLAGWWNATDLDLRYKLKLIADDIELEKQKQERDEEKRKMLLWLQKQKLIALTWQDCDIDKVFDMDLYASILLACADCRSQLVLLQLEDLELNPIPVNIPGTSTEYANWQRKLNTSIDDLFKSPSIVELLRTFDQRRRQSTN